MSAVRRALAVGSLAASAVIAAPPAGAVPRTIVRNLDRDPALERVVVRGRFGVGERVVLEDPCRGETVRHRLAVGGQTVDALRVRELDGATRRPEIFLDLRSGAAGHLGVIKVVRLGPSRRPCPTPVELFRYRPDHPPVRPPAGYSAVNFSARTRDYSRLYPGLEVRLAEGLFGPNDTALCCPSLARVTKLRYSRAEGRYVVYATRLVRFGLTG